MCSFFLSKQIDFGILSGLLLTVYITLHEISARTMIECWEECSVFNMPELTEVPEWLNVPNDTTVHIENTSLSRIKPGDFYQVNNTIFATITLCHNKISVIESGTFDGTSQEANTKALLIKIVPLVLKFEIYTYIC